MKKIPSNKLDVPKGLRDTKVEETIISSCDSNKGLNYFGYPVEYLACICEFEEVAYLLQYKELPQKKELEEYKTKIMKATRLSNELKDYIKIQPKESTIQNILRIVLNYMSVKNPEKKDFSNKNDIETEIIGVLPSVIVYWKNFIENKEVDFETTQDSLVGFFLEKFCEKNPSKDEIKVFNSMLISYMEHELNASTYTAIVASSTKTDYYNCIIGALSTFWGPIHGGACKVVIDQIEAFSGQNLKILIQEKLNKHEKIYGFGHGAYRKKGDPRTPIIKELARKLTNENEYYQMIEELEEIMKGKKENLPVNVDLYSSLIMLYFGIKSEYCTAIIAMSRVCGWSAHIDEKREEGTLIRPRALYKGNMKSLNILMNNILERYQKEKLTENDFLYIQKILMEKYKKNRN